MKEEAANAAVDLPVAAMGVGTSTGAQRPWTETLRLRVLLVAISDREASRALQALRRGGFDVRHRRVATLEDLADALGGGHWHVVISEFRMPALDGPEVLRCVQSGGLAIPVVYICGVIGEDAAVGVVKAGAHDCISKSGVAMRLATSVRDALKPQTPKPEAAADPAMQGALDALPAAIYTCDAKGRVTMFNHAAQALWGRAPELGKDLWCGSWKVFQPDGQLLPLEQCPMAVMLRTGRAVVGRELIVERPDYGRTHVVTYPRPLFSADGEMVGGVNLMVDVGALRSAQHKQVDSAKAAIGLFENMPMAGMLMLPFSTIKHVNERFVHLIGYARDELVGKTFRELNLRVDDALGLQLLAELRQNGAVDKLQVHLRRKDGTHRLVLISSCLMDFDGESQRLHTFIDITDQRHAIQEARLVRQAMASISQGVVVTGRDRMIRSVNSAFETMTGFSEHELRGRPCSLLQGEHTDPVVVSEMREALDLGQTYSGDLLNYRKDRTPFWNALTINPVFDANGQLTHYFGLLRDVTERRAEQTQLKLAAQVFAQGHEGITVTDAKGSIVLVNRAFSDITGYTEQDVMGRDHQEIAFALHDAALRKATLESIRTCGSWHGDTVGRRKDGSEYPQQLTISTVRDANGEICNYVRTFSDQSEQSAARDRISWLSHFDTLTGLPNRDRLAERCDSDISVAQRESGHIAMMVLGIDHFKQINDAQGYAVGDRILKKIAGRLRRAVREQVTVARVGGDEFALLLPGETQQDTTLLADRLLELSAQPFGIGDNDIRMTVSIGIALYPADGHDFESIYKSAQVAMHQAKRGGRGAQRFFSAKMLETTLVQASIASALHQAVALDQLDLHYQPYVDLQTGRIGGMEALLRWTHPTLGAVPPSQFIPVAEQTGMIIELGDWVLRRSCRDMRRWLDLGLAVPPMAVNISPVQFRNPTMLQQVEAILAEHAIAPGMISLELTEGAVMDDVVHSESLLRAFKQLGVHLSLDDFGTGYSSLSYLKRFPFDKVKIDQSFVSNLHTSSQDAVIAKVVIAMAHGLGLRVIAEGVETEQQCEFMRSNVCDEIQGYFFSRPVQADAMQAMLVEDRRLPAHLVRMRARERTLLLVDDEPNVIASLKRLLRRDGYRILTANSGAEGLELLAASPVDIIVSDQRMPGMTGVEFLRHAKSAHPDTIRIVLSGHTELQSVTDAINEGAVFRFLTKPWDDEQLRGCIQEAFRHKELADENAQLNLKVRTANQELAASNRQLRDVLDAKQRELKRGAHSLDVVQEALQSIPMPVLAIDDEGMIAFANQMAQDLFADRGPLLACDLAQTLPELDRALTGTTEGTYGQAVVNGKPCRIHWHGMGNTSRSSGRIVTVDLVDDGGQAA